MKAELAQLAKMPADTAREQESVHMQHACSQIYNRKQFYDFINMVYYMMRSTAFSAALLI